MNCVSLYKPRAWIIEIVVSVAMDIHRNNPIMSKQRQYRVQVLRDKGSELFIRRWWDLRTLRYHLYGDFVNESIDALLVRSFCIVFRTFVGFLWREVNHVANLSHLPCPVAADLLADAVPFARCPSKLPVDEKRFPPF